jgi:putative spermidine/putrescine transport system permease protein
LPHHCWCSCERSRCSSHVPDGGARPQTLVVALYYAVFAAGVRAPQSVDAMAMIYMAVTLVWLLIALRFVNPTQLVSRVKEHPQHA